MKTKKVVYSKPLENSAQCFNVIIFFDMRIGPLLLLLIWIWGVLYGGEWGMSFQLSRGARRNMNISREGACPVTFTKNTSAN